MDAKFSSLESCDDLSILNGIAFEEYLRQLFSDLGYKATKTPASGDYGVDLILIAENRRIVVQAKQYSKPVGFDAIKEVHFGKSYYHADEAWVVSTGGFTKQAFSSAKETSVKLLGPEDINQFIASVRRGEKILPCEPKKSNWVDCKSDRNTAKVSATVAFSPAEPS